jgi:CheY-like chemotaxis protein
MPRVLLIEDDDYNREMLARRLLRRGFEVLEAADGEEGCTRASQDLPDLILMDLRLPPGRMSGFDATRCLKAAPETRSIPILALTGDAVEARCALALEAGCDDYDTKPVVLNRLLDKMQKLLQRKSPS